ncbi:MAG: biopolymer transporter ExbD [Deltaproteobacteria bacterium]|nr:biopolymer transporter ExbD [Deltaproteobacteria bacterium]
MSGRKTFTAAQHAYINRKSKPREHDPADAGGEINIVPFLDIVTNILMFILATITTVFTATIAMPAPSSGPSTGGGAGNTEVNITVKIVRDGYIVGAPGGFLQPGCSAVAGAALTVPLIPGPAGQAPMHDYLALTRCMETIRNNPEWRTELADNHKIQIAGNQDIPYRVLVGTLDAVRETRLGAKDMFFEPTLGILN